MMMFVCISPHPQSFEEDGLSKEGDRGRIQKAASAIISALSKRHNSTVMLAVVEVKVETQVESPPIGESRDPLRHLFFLHGFLQSYMLTAPPSGYLLPVVGVAFGLLWIICIVVCVLWTRKRKKDRERAVRAEDMTVNNQLEPLRGHAPKDNRDRDVRHERRKLMAAADRKRDSADGIEEAELEGGEEEEDDDKDQRMGLKGSVAGAQDRGGAGKAELICTSRSFRVKAPHRTAYSPKDNRCKNLNAARLSEDVKDHYV